MPRSGATTLSDLTSATLILVCNAEACKRRGVYNVERLKAKHGDARLTDLRSFLTAGCPKHVTFENMSRCEASFEPYEVRPKDWR
jgi:hypothetical protein